MRGISSFQGEEDLTGESFHATPCCVSKYLWRHQARQKAQIPLPNPLNAKKNLDIVLFLLPYPKLLCF